MADRSVSSTDTLDTLRTTYNSTAVDVGDITSVTGASGVIGAATDIIEAITLMNTEVTGIKAGTSIFGSSIKLIIKNWMNFQHIWKLALI